MTRYTENVEYEMSQKPDTFVEYNRKRRLYEYNFNFRKEECERDEQHPDGIRHVRSSIIVQAPISSNSVFAELLAAIYEPSVEQKLINDYNSYKLGLEGYDKSREDAYKAFLEVRGALHKQVEEDCLANGYPL